MKEINEEWKNVVEYEEFYQISNFGNIKRLKREIPHLNSIRIFEEKILKPCICHKGYQFIRLSKNGKMKAFKIHRLVAIHFIENLRFLSQVNHIDHNKLNNYYLNLEWVSNRENKNHYFKSINTSSIYPGVNLIKNTQKWRSKIRIGKDIKYLGQFEDEKDAYLVYLKAKEKYNIIDKYSENYE